MMSDHKVIFWDEDGWNITWLNKKDIAINKKTIKVDIDHKILKEKSTNNLSDTKESKEAYIKIKEFADTISDDNTLDISIKDYMMLNNTIKSKLEGYIGKCVQWEEQSVLLDPYILGLWLGCGAESEYKMALTIKDEPKIFKYFKNDMTLKQYGNVYNFTNNKHIPKKYIVNSLDIRLKVLAGIIDIVGYVSQNSNEICITQCFQHQKFVDDIIFLAKSLGYMVRSSRNIKDKVCMLNISGIGIENIPTLVKRIKRNNSMNRNSMGTGLLKIQEIEAGDYVGLEVDGNNRFVLDDFTVTHNCNIFSTSFIVETVDEHSQKKYTQEFKNNMEIVGKPKIVKFTGKGYTKITFKPDFQLLGKGDASQLDDDIINLFHRRVLDMTACTDESVSVYWNNKKINCKSFEKYVEMYIGPKGNLPRVYEKVNDRWEVIVCPWDSNSLEHVSFVNGIYTFRGGEHVDYVSNQIARKMNNQLKKKKGNKINLKEAHIKDNMMLFLKCSIENPSFSSQTKEYMTTVTKNFGSKCTVSDQFIDKLSKTGILQQAQKLGEFKDSIKLDKSVTSSKKRRLPIPKYEPANWAGGKKSKECVLILTEGDSAKSSAEAGFNIIGRDTHGIFPLRGKLLNVRDATLKQIANNAEINYIKEIMGLQFFKKGTKQKMVYNKDLTGLNYGRIMIMCDQDLDGFHIKGLLMNYIGHFWPSLLEIPGFISAFKTPIVIATKKNKKGEKVSFFSLKNYSDWKKEINLNQWNIKYYKGLGTSNRTDFQDYFRNFDDHYLEYNNDDDGADEALNLAFSKKLADKRKDWLGEYDPDDIIDASLKHISYRDLVHKELKHFSNYDNHRNIPNICDGLKPSQRKVIHYLLKYTTNYDEIKVAQLAGSVAGKTDYHHGENSMMDTIINMAQDHMGSNNINLLHPEGQFGTRRLNGKDSSSARYIYTYLAPIAKILYKSYDLPLLKYLEDDNGKQIEPEWFLPILPMILINGSEGIGTGYSTFVSLHNPMDVVNNIRNLLKSKDTVEMKPWFRGFNGLIIKEENKDGCDKYITYGKYNVPSNNEVNVTELPVGMSTEKYKEYLSSLIIDGSEKDLNKKKRQCLIDFWDNSTDTQVNFTLKFTPKKYQSFKSAEKLEELLKISSSNQTKDTYMHLFNAEHKITRYNSADDILHEFYHIRLEYYQKRKDYLLSNIKMN